MPRELLDAFSKRTAQVDALLAVKVNEFRDREGQRVDWAAPQPAFE